MISALDIEDIAKGLNTKEIKWRPELFEIISLFARANGVVDLDWKGSEVKMWDITHKLGDNLKDKDYESICS